MYTAGECLWSMHVYILKEHIFRWREDRLAHEYGRYTDETRKTDEFSALKPMIILGRHTALGVFGLWESI